MTRVEKDLVPAINSLVDGAEGHFSAVVSFYKANGDDVSDLEAKIKAGATKMVAATSKAVGRSLPGGKRLVVESSGDDKAPKVPSYSLGNDPKAKTISG